MKKVLVLILAVILICALAGCNVAPNVPGVTPYSPYGVYGTVPDYTTNPPFTGTAGPYTGTPGNYGNFLGRGTAGSYSGGSSSGYALR